MASPIEKRKKRESLLLQWFMENRYTLKQVTQMLNSQIEKPVSNRTIDIDIKRIKVSLQEQGKELKNTNGIYKIIESTGIGKLTEDEKLAIPLIERLLEPYLIIPGIGALIEELKIHHGVSQIDKTWVKNSVAFTSPHFVMNAKMKNAVLTLLQYMQKGVACAFNYNDVHQRSESNKLWQIYPLQIRENLGRLYLVAIPIDDKINQRYIRIFAIDCILGLKIESLEDLFEGDNTMTSKSNFDYKSVIKQLDLSNYFNEVVGVWRPPSISPKTIKRYFAGWALSHIEACPLHSSQVKIYQSASKISLKHLKNEESLMVGLIQLEIHDTPELSYRLASYRDYSWAHHYGPNGPDYKINWEF